MTLLVAPTMHQWLHFGRTGFRPLLLAVARNGLKAGQNRLSDKHIAGLIGLAVQDAWLQQVQGELDQGGGVLIIPCCTAEISALEKTLGHASRRGEITHIASDKRRSMPKR
jgi:hypothetical protein